jgi:endonuclease/exonuclease/phosphatase family metal-dependent hydrolase
MERAESEGIEVTVTSWNILDVYYELEKYYGVDLKYLHWNDGRRERVIEWLGNHFQKTDVFCLQECNPKMANEIVHALQAKYSRPIRWLHQRRKQADDDGCLVIFDAKKFKSFDFHVHQFQSEAHIFLALKLTSLINPQISFWVVNAHIDWCNRSRDLIELFSEVPKLGPEPKLVMGDFNAVASEEWYQKTLRVNALDLYQTYWGSQPEWTFGDGKEKSKSIDFIFALGIQKTDLKACYFGLSPEWSFPKERAGPTKDIPSDHLPVTATVRITVRTYYKEGKL